LGILGSLLLTAAVTFVGLRRRAGRGRARRCFEAEAAVPLLGGKRQPVARGNCEYQTEMSWRMLFSWREWRTPHVWLVYLAVYVGCVLMLLLFWRSLLPAGVFFAALVAFVVVCVFEVRYRRRGASPPR
jgi:hypothetical protein